MRYKSLHNSTDNIQNLMNAVTKFTWVLVQASKLNYMTLHTVGLPKSILDVEIQRNASIVPQLHVHVHGDITADTHPPSLQLANQYSLHY